MKQNQNPNRLEVASSPKFVLWLRDLVLRKFSLRFSFFLYSFIFYLFFKLIICLCFFYNTLLYFIYLYCLCCLSFLTTEAVGFVI